MYTFSPLQRRSQSIQGILSYKGNYLCHWSFGGGHAAIESPRVRVHWYLNQDKCMFQSPAGEVASFTEESIHSLPNVQLFSNERNIPKQIIYMDDEEDSNTIYSISRQVSVRSSPLLKDISNESLYKAHFVNVNVLTKKVAALSDSMFALRMPSSGHKSTCMDVLVQLKNSPKADLIDIWNFINDVEDEVQRQHDKIHSLSEIISKQEITKRKSDKKIADL